MIHPLVPYRLHQLLDTGNLGGGNLVGLAIARHLRAAGLDSAVWLEAGPAEAEARAAGVEVHRFDRTALREAGRLRGRWLEWQLARRLRRGRPGLIHVHSAYVYGLTARALRASGLATVAHVHLEQPEADWRWAFRVPPERIVTCARYLVEPVRRAVGPNVPVEAVPNAVDTERFRPSDRPPNERFVILMLANLSPTKGQATAIEALARLPALGVEAELWLAGVERDPGGGYEARLRARVAELGLGDRVRFLGQRADAPELLQMADAFLLPSTNEGLPLSVLEAQAAGVPVVASPLAGVGEVVADGATGFLVPPDDPAGYAERIVRLARDPDARRAIAVRARHDVEAGHSWPAYLRRIEQLYEATLTGQTAGSPE